MATSKSLSVAIALDGAKEIEKQLADIGAAGQKAFKDIEKAAKAAGGFDQIKPEQVTAKLKELGVVGEEAFRKINAAVATATRTERLVESVRTVEIGIKAFSGSMLGLIRAFGPLGLAIGVAGAAFSKLANFASDAAEAIGKVDTAAAKIGIGIQQYDKLRAALQQGGISAKSAEEAIQKVADATQKVQLDKVAESAKKLQEVIARGSDPRTSNLLQPLLTLAQGVGPVADAAKAALAGLNIQFTAAEQRLQQLASSGTQSLDQLAKGFNAPAVAGRSWVQATGELATGTDRVKAALQAFVRQLEAIKDPAERNRVAFQQMGQAGLDIARGISTGAISSKQSIDELTKNVTLLSDKSADSAAKIEQSFNRSAAAWERFKTTGDPSELGTVFSEVATRVSISFGVMGQELSALGGKIAELATNVGGAIWDTFASAGTAAINAVSSALDGLLRKLSEAVALSRQLGGGAGAPVVEPGFAGGGFVRGPGSSTSDSILARLSRGEFVINARAVQHWGSSFFAALNSLQRPPGFALGGPVAMPAFAGGGSIGSMSHVTIQFPGLPAVTGLRASSDVVEQLQRAAAMAQVRSGGRKPSRYT